MSKEIVVRFSSTAGRSRLNLAPTATFQELQEKVLGVTKVDAASQRLAFDEQGQRPVAGAPTASLASLGIVNGTQVFLLGAGATIQAQVLTKVPVPVEPEKTVPAVTDASTPGASSTAKPAPDALATTGGASSSAVAKPDKPKGGIDPKDWSDKADRKAKFETFDTFIRDRRYETSNLQGNHEHKSVQLKAGNGMIKIPPSVSIKQQPYRHVDQVSIYNDAEVQNFLSYWRYECLPEAQQRMGWLYGYYLEDPFYGEKDRGDGCRIVVEGVYEPPQLMVGGECVMQADPDKAQVDKIADALGLECVGHIFTSFPLDGDQLITPLEMLRIARLQNQYSTDAHFTKYRLSKFVACAVRPDPANEGAPDLNSFMVSDQCVALARDGMFQEECTGTDVVVREAVKGECLPTFLVEGKGNRNILTDFFIVRLVDSAPKKKISLFTHAEFPRENRRGKIVQQDDLKKYFKKRSKQEASWSRFADFHLLIYIAKAFDVDTCIQLCECVRERKEIPEGLKILFESLMQ